MKTYDIGFLGGGQLARMSIQAAQRMGLTCLSLDPGVDGPAAQVADGCVGPLDDASSVARILSACGQITLENEFIPAPVLTEAFRLARRPEERLLPRIDTLATIQDKLRQRQAYLAAGVPSPMAVAMEDDPVGAIGFPMVLKARFGGYDGKGTRTVRDAQALERLRPEWEQGGWLAEQFVPFRRELAVMVFSTPTRIGCFPTMETVQKDHVCDLVFPSGVDASAVAIAAVRAVNGIGLIGVELFELEDGTFQVNEIAPRPHNSGHYTLDWGATSQFEQHVRMVCGFEPGTVDGTDVCMANLIGQSESDDFHLGLAAATRYPGVHVHWYGKAVSKPGRKMGHLNARGKNCVSTAIAARQVFYDPI